LSFSDTGRSWKVRGVTTEDCLSIRAYGDSPTCKLSSEEARHSADLPPNDRRGREMRTPVFMAKGLVGAMIIPTIWATCKTIINALAN